MGSFIYTITFISILVFEFADCKGNTCPTTDNTTECCDGSRMIKDVCTECIGFFGKNCSSPCPDDFYGAKCLTRCNCSQSKYCNPYVGCLPNESGTANGDITFEKKEFHHSDINCGTITIIFFVLCGSRVFVLASCIVMVCYWRRSKNSVFLNPRKTNQLCPGQINDTCSTDHDCFPQSRDRNTAFNNYSHIRFRKEELIIHNSDDYSKTVLPNSHSNAAQNVKTVSTDQSFSDGSLISEYSVAVKEKCCPSDYAKANNTQLTPRPYSLANYNRDFAQKVSPMPQLESTCERHRHRTDVEEDKYHKLIPQY